MDKKNPLLIFQLLLMAPLAGIGIDLFVPSLPEIARQLGTSAVWVKFTISYYLIGYAIGQPIFGSLSDSLGRKKPLLFGIILYIIVSYCISLSQNIHVMLWLRLLQGVVVAAPGVLSKAIMTDSFSGQKLVKIATFMTMTWAIGPIIAPVIGGYLETFFGWQSNFYFFAIYGILLLLLIAFTFKETHFNRLKLNIPTLLKTYGEALSHKAFIGSLLCISIVYSLVIIFNVMGPFLIQKVMGYSAISYGHFALFMGLGFFLGSMANRVLIQRFPIPRIFTFTILYGCLIAALMLVFAILFGIHILTLILFTFLLLLSAGSIFPNSMAKCLSLFPKSAGTATAIMGSFFIIGSAIISFIASTLTTTSLVPIALLFLILMVLCLSAYFGLIYEKTNP